MLHMEFLISLSYKVRFCLKRKEGRITRRRKEGRKKKEGKRHGGIEEDVGEYELSAIGNSVWSVPPSVKWHYVSVLTGLQFFWT